MMTPQPSIMAALPQAAPHSCGTAVPVKAPHIAVPVDGDGKAWRWETTRPDAEGQCRTCSGPIVFDEFWGWLHAGAPTRDQLPALAALRVSRDGQTR
jgi:hypothetical protein